MYALTKVVNANSEEQWPCHLLRLLMYSCMLVCSQTCHGHQCQTRSGNVVSMVQSGRWHEAHVTPAAEKHAGGAERADECL